MFLWYLLPPMVSCFLACIFLKKRPEINPGAVFQFIHDLLLYPVCVSLLLVPMDRAVLLQTSWGISYPKYGLSAIALAFFLAVLLGLLRLASSGLGQKCFPRMSALPRYILQTASLIITHPLLAAGLFLLIRKYPSYLWFFVFPTLSIIVSSCLTRIRGGKQHDLLYSWLMQLPLYPLLCALIFLPLDRMKPGYTSIGFPYPIWGSTAILLLGLTACALGVWLSLSQEHLVAAAYERSCARVRFSFGRAMLHLFGFFTHFMLLFYFWGHGCFLNISIEEILFYLNMPLQGTSTTFISDLITHVLLPSLISLLAAILLMYFPSRTGLRLEHASSKKPVIDLRPLRLPRRATAFILLCAWVFMLSKADALLNISGFIESRIHPSSFIEEEYVDPRNTALSFPEQPRNLIWICVESAETTNQDRTSGGHFDVNYTPEMTQLALEHVSFSQSGLLEGAAVAPACGWTIAGLVAQTAGVPLKFFEYNDDGADNMGKNLVSFLPGVTSLGDILEENGYRNVYMAGSYFEFGGRTQYFSQHGHYDIWDLHTAETEHGFVYRYDGWGLRDCDLFGYAKEEILALAQSGQPFNFSLLTVDTHHPGFTCPICPKTHDIEFGNVLSCSSAQVFDFVSWCQEQPFYENTTIVITGDHASMVSGFYEVLGSSRYEKHTGDTTRLVYNVFINAPIEPVQMKNRLFTTLDFFPTILASLGVTIEGDRLALGTNLFSDTPTLAEVYGYDHFFTELNKRSAFYDEHLLYPEN